MSTKKRPSKRNKEDDTDGDRTISSLDSTFFREDGKYALQLIHHTDKNFEITTGFCIPTHGRKFTSKKFTHALITHKKQLLNSPRAIFDLDGTLICPKNGKKFPKKDDSSDWEFAYPSVVKDLRKLSQKNYSIAIVTNQKKLNLEVWQEKLWKVAQELQCPFQILVARGDDQYRKPCIGFEEHLFNRICKDPKRNDTFFCGDAAGRKGDHSDTDRKFAINLGIQFYTPEELFLREAKLKNGERRIKEVPYDIKYPFYEWSRGMWISDKKVDMRDYGECGRNKYAKTSSNILHLLVGLPGSGKSTYVKSELENLNACETISGDKLKCGVEGCLKKAAEVIAKNKPQHLIIDNTNLDLATRQKWSVFAKKHKYQIVCHYMLTSNEFCQHNIHFRNALNPAKKIIPKFVFNMMVKKTCFPCIKKEGFLQLIKIPFFPDSMNREIENKYFQYYF
jgi:bifunctional polynucleotide phosphatase/kinase